MQNDMKHLKRNELVQVIYQQQVELDERNAEITTLKDKIARLESADREQVVRMTEMRNIDAENERLTRIDRHMTEMSEQIDSVRQMISQDYERHIQDVEQRCAHFQKKLDARLSVEGKAGSLAETVVGLSGIFERAGGCGYIFSRNSGWQQER